MGFTLDEIALANTPASFEPALDYVVTKIARFPFDKFDKASRLLSTQMKATGEVMAVGRTFEESLLKAVRSLEAGANCLRLEKFDAAPDAELWEILRNPTDERLFAIAELLRRGAPVRRICRTTKIDRFFVEKLAGVVSFERELAARPATSSSCAAPSGWGFRTVASGGCGGGASRRSSSCGGKTAFCPSTR